MVRYPFEDGASALPFPIHDGSIGPTAKGELREWEDSALDFCHVWIDADPICFEDGIFVVVKDPLLCGNVLLADSRFLKVNIR